MPDLIRVADYSSVFIPNITAASANELAQSYQGVVIGYDSGAASAEGRAMLVAAGLEWTGAYRLPVSWLDIPSQVNDTIRGLHMAATLPRYLILDIESTSGLSLSIAQIEQAMDTVEAASILPNGTLVKPCIYSSLGIWSSVYPGYTGPADRGWFVWVADWSAPADLVSARLFGAFTEAQVVGHQFDGSTASAIGTVDESVFATAQPAPSPIDPGSALNDLRNAIPLMQQALALVQNGAADITPAGG